MQPKKNQTPGWGPSTCVRSIDEMPVPSAMGDAASVGSGIDLGALTVTTDTIGENLKGMMIVNPETNRLVIATVDAPKHPEGGIAVLYGTLAPQGSVVILRTGAD